MRAQYGFFEIYVKGIYQGSPADRSGAITEGDTLIEVNGENVRGMSLRQVCVPACARAHVSVCVEFLRQSP